MTIEKLQNSNDIRGTALVSNVGKDPNFGPSEAFIIFHGFISYLKNTRGESLPIKVAVGMDPRLSGPSIVAGIKTMARELGVSIVDCGLSSTPAMFMSTVFDEIQADGAIMITASHLPFERNGMKFFAKKGGIDKADIKFILEDAKEYGDSLGKDVIVEKISNYCQDNCPFDRSSETAYGFAAKECAPAKNNELSCLMSLYTAHLRNIIIDGLKDFGDELPLSHMNIMVDAGNGSGGFFEKHVLKPLGANTNGSLFLDPNGNFPNHEPNPENKEAMRIFSEAVKNQNVDLGIIFDTDVDRASAVTSAGLPISRNSIVALAAALVADENPGTTIVTDSITSTQLTDFIENSLGLKHLRFQRGYKNVINKAIFLNGENVDCQLAIETSGHGAYKENYFLDDGAYLATKIVVKAARLKKSGEKIESLIKDLKVPLEAEELRFPIKDTDNFKEIGSEIISAMEIFGENPELKMTLVKPNYEGVRIAFANSDARGWCLLRASLHDPLLVLNIESDVSGGATNIKNCLRKFLSQFEKLNIDSL